jgi:hypothetical protein
VLCLNGFRVALRMPINRVVHTVKLLSSNHFQPGLPIVALPQHDSLDESPMILSIGRAWLRRRREGLSPGGGLTPLVSL